MLAVALNNLAIDDLHEDLMMKAQKISKAARIAELERKLQEALAGQAHIYRYACDALKKASTDDLCGSGVVITMTALGGREILMPTLIRDGLSVETLAALKNDFIRSYDLATQLKPK